MAPSWDKGPHLLECFVYIRKNRLDSWILPAYTPTQRLLHAHSLYAHGLIIIQEDMYVNARTWQCRCGRRRRLGGQSWLDSSTCSGGLMEEEVVEVKKENENVLNLKRFACNKVVNRRILPSASWNHDLQRKFKPNTRSVWLFRPRMLFPSPQLSAMLKARWWLSSSFWSWWPLFSYWLLNRWPVRREVDPVPWPLELFRLWVFVYDWNVFVEKFLFPDWYRFVHFRLGGHNQGAHPACVDVCTLHDTVPVGLHVLACDHIARNDHFA